MRAVLISIQPYWVFLIIAKTMGWNIGEEKTVEIRKSCPKNDNWNKTAKIYCTKDKKSFSQIPKEYQPLMERLLGKVIGEFVCDRIYEIGYDYFYPCGYEVSMGEISRKELYEKSCLSFNQMDEYLKMELGYGWHISNLVIYDKPRELSEFYTKCDEGCEDCDFWKSVRVNADEYDMECSSSIYGHRLLKRPPQSWCYVESGGVE